MQKKNKVILLVLSIAGALTLMFFTQIFLFVFTVISGILFLPGYYIYRKAIKTTGSEKVKYSLLGILIALSMAFPMGFAFMHFVPSFPDNFFLIAILETGLFWLPAGLYLFLTTLAVSIIAYLGEKMKIVKKETVENPKVRLAALAFILTVTTVTMVFAYRAQDKTIYSRYNVELPQKSGRPDSLRVVIISDLHLTFNTPDNWVKDKVSMINAIKPDLVLVVGDIVDSRPDLLKGKPFSEDFHALKPRLGVWAVTGNHEHFDDLEESRRFIRSCGFILMDDSLALVDSAFYLAGRTDRMDKGRRKLSEILSAKTADLPVILMDHQPRGLDEAVENDVGLQVSGHTHHGQMFPLNIATHFMYKVSWGYDKIGNTQFIVSCGLGLWGPQYRVCSRSEIVFADIIIK